MEKKRLLFIDNLRILLLILVISHHIFATFGSPFGWYLTYEADSFVAFVLFTLFGIINQPFFMALYFFIAGYFTPSSYNKGGPKEFLKNKLLKIFLPMIIYDTFIAPLMYYFIYVSEGNKIGFWDYVANKFSFTIGSEHLWFIERLFEFFVLYVIVRLLIKGEPKKESKVAPLKFVTPFMLIFGCLVFIKRVWITFDEIPQFLTIDFPFFPTQYILWFILGIFAYYKGWMESITKKVGIRSIIFSFLSLIVFFGLYFVGGGMESVQKFVGGFYWQSFVASLWEQVFGAGMIIGLIGLFRHFFNKEIKPLNTLRDNAFELYFLHGLIIVPICIYINKLAISSLAKAGLSLLSSAIAVYGISLLFSKIREVRRKTV